MKKYPKFEYIPVNKQGLSKSMWDHWGELIPIALCSDCRRRMARDPTRNLDGTPLPEDAFLFEEEKQPVCDPCIHAAEEADVLDLLERKLGLGERDRDALRSFIETIFTDPQKILQVRDLDNRVRNLEKQANVLWIVLGVIVALLAIVATMAVAL